MLIDTDLIASKLGERFPGKSPSMEVRVTLKPDGQSFVSHWVWVPLADGTIKHAWSESMDQALAECAQKIERNAGNKLEVGK